MGGVGRDHLRLGVSLVLAATVVGGALWGLGSSLQGREPRQSAKPTVPQTDAAAERRNGPPPGAAMDLSARNGVPGLIRVCEQGGRQTFSDTPCGPGMREVRQIRPKENSGGVGGSVYAEQLTRMPPTAPVMRAVPAIPSPATGSVQAPAPDHARCQALFEYIRQIDAAARMPQAPPELDRLRAERKRANDEIFTLRCESLGRS